MIWSIICCLTSSLEYFCTTSLISTYYVFYRFQWKLGILSQKFKHCYKWTDTYWMSVVTYFLYHGHTLSIYIKNDFKSTLFWFLEIHCYDRSSNYYGVYTGMRRIQVASILRSLKQKIFRFFFCINTTLMLNSRISTINEIFGWGVCMYGISNHLRLL